MNIYIQIILYCNINIGSILVFYVASHVGVMLSLVRVINNKIILDSRNTIPIPMTI